MNTQLKWDHGVATYISIPDLSNVEVNLPACVRNLGDMRGQTIVDYGCGGGRLARSLKRLGAKTVIATDLSKTAIRLAQANDPDNEISYYLMQDNRLPFVEDASVDQVVANLVFMMATSKEEMAASYREIERVLRPGGRFVQVITHPCFIERGAHDYRNIFPHEFTYMHEGGEYRFILQDKNGEDVESEFFDHHYTLTTYITALLEAGFRLSHFEELAYPADFVEKCQLPAIFQTYPQSLVLVGDKTSKC